MNNRGFLLVEIVVTVTVVTVVLGSVLTLYAFVFKSESHERNKVQAQLYAQEALEAVEFVSRYDWNQMSDGAWHPRMDGGVWKLFEGSETLDSRFTRTLTISPVSRVSASNGHAFGDITTSGGINDPETKLVTATVSWTQAALGVQTVTYQTYQARDRSQIFSQTNWSGGPDQEDFVNTSKFAVAHNVDFSAPGVLTLSANYLTWDNALVTAERDLPSNVDAQAIFLSGTILFVGTDNNAGPTGHELYAFDINNLGSPVLLGSVNVNSSVYGLYVNGSYAALATADDNAELQIWNVSNPANMTRLASRNLPTNSDALDVTVWNNFLYVIQGSTMYTFNYSDPANPTQTHSINLGSGVLNAISVQGRRAFIASTISNKEFAIVDVTNPSDTVEIASYDLPGNRQATDVYAFGIYAYVVTSNSGTYPEFYMFHIANPFNPQLLGTYEVGENVFAVSALSNFAFVGSNLLGDDILVLDISNPSSIFLRKGYNVKGTATDIFPTPEAIHIASTANDAELIIISVNSTVDLYPPSGYAESSTFDTLSPTSTYNWISWVGGAPVNTSLKFQIATNNDKTLWNYVGPDSTPNTYYQSLTRELLNYSAYLNKRYVRYKVLLESSDRASTPFLFGVDVSYSP